MRACGKTDVGLRRHENQDTFAVEQGKKLLIAVVCDGMGGAEGGQIASSVAVETFMKEMRALIRADMTAEQLRELASFCVAKANTAVYQRALQDPAYQAWARRSSAQWQRRSTPSSATSATAARI